MLICFSIILLIIVKMKTVIVISKKKLNLHLLMISINILNETDRLRAVLVGLAHDFGGTPSIDQCYDPKSKEHVLAGSFSNNSICIEEISSLVSVLEHYNVKVYRPENIKGLNQIFSRDIVFVIEDKLILPNIIKDRSKELLGIHYLLDNIPSSQKIVMPKDARVEGGDVIVWNEYIFVGYSEQEDFEKYKVARTNINGLNFLKKAFPDKIVKAFELKKSDDNARKNALHLDCCFQPIGKDMAILYKGGFKNQKDVDFLVNYFTKQKIIELNTEEMYNMNANIFSISEQVIISEKNFLRLNNELRKKGFIIEEVSFSEIGKMSGLLRCSTMPLIRE